MPLISISMENNSNCASLSLFGSPPVLYNFENCENRSPYLCDTPTPAVDYNLENLETLHPVYLVPRPFYTILKFVRLLPPAY